MSPFLEKVGVAIASRIGITAAIALIAATILGGGYWWVKSLAPRETVKAETGEKVDVEELGFYGTGDLKVSGRVYRPSGPQEGAHPAVIYCQSVGYGDGWCRTLAGNGIVSYCFDFQGDGEKARTAELEAVLKGLRNLRQVDAGKVYLLGEGNGCLTACTLAFDKPKQVKGLILVSPGFNPLEISRKAQHYRGTVLVVDDALGRKANVEEILTFIK